MTLTVQGCWIGILVLGVVVLILFTKSKEVYDAFTNFNLNEGFVSTQINDIELKTCPADYKQFIDNDGKLMCCDGEASQGKCKRVICSLSEGGSVPTCSSWYTAYLEEKGRDRCPLSMPNYYESKDKQLKGCTSGRRKVDGTAPIGSGIFCKLYTSERDEISKRDSCTNQKILETAQCFSGTTPVTKSIVEQGTLPALITCSFKDTTGNSLVTYSKDSFDRHHTAKSGSSWKQNFKSWDPLSKTSASHIAEKYYIDKTLSLFDLPYIGWDFSISTNPSDFVMYGEWIGSFVPVQKISSLPNGEKYL